MSSVLTNTSAMVALQTMRGINANMQQTQSEISTGKSIATAKDNASIWAISKVMESDVAGFDTISSNLSLGESTVSVARAASETVTDLLVDIKGKIVDAQQDNKDRGKIQTDISALKDQIKSVVSAAQFNGLNLVDGNLSQQNGNGEAGIDVLASLDRKSDGSVTANQISVNAANLSTSAGVELTAASVTDQKVSIEAGGSFTVDADNLPADWATGDSLSLDIGGTAVADGGATSAAEVATNLQSATLPTGWTATQDGNKVTFTNNTASSVDVTVTGSLDNGGNPITLDSGANSPISTITNADGSTVEGTSISSGETITFDGGNITLQGTDGALASDAASADPNDKTGLIAGDEIKLNIGSTAGRYTVQEGDSSDSIVAGLKNSLVANGLSSSDFDIEVDDAGQLTVTNNTNESVGYSFEATRGSGALADLESLDVTTAESAADALADIEGMIDAAIQASADFGSAQGRLETQQNFVSKLTDSLKAGIGSLVDADMEETSARLQSLQVQQQLSTQALSIANQQPQSLLSLFR